MSGVLRDRRLWLLTLLGAAVGAVYGLRFGPSIGETPLVGAVALGIMGLAPGFAAGLGVAWARQRSLTRQTEDADRMRFVESLNERAQPGNRFSISSGDRCALIMNISNPRDVELTPAVQDRLRQRLEPVIDAHIAGTAADLRRHGFERWIVQCDSTTLLRRELPKGR